jgi:hypothetical protein
MLATSPGQITGVLIAGAVFLLLLLVLYALSGVQGELLAQSILGLVFTWYLFGNVKRLAAETKNNESATLASR